VATYFALQARRESALAEASARRSEQRRYVSDIQLAQRAWEEGDPERLGQLLEGLRPQETGGQDLRGFEWHYLWRMAHADLFAFTAPAGSLGFNFCFGPDGTPLAGFSKGGRLRLLDLGANRELRTIEGVQGVIFSPGGTRLASARPDDHRVAVWDLATGKEVCILTGASPNSQVVFSRDGKLLAAAESTPTPPFGIRLIRLWDAVTGQPLGKGWKPPADVAQSHNSRLALSADGSRLAAVLGGVTKVWETMTGKECFQLRTAPSASPPVALSPDGACLVSSANDHMVTVWEVGTGIKRFVFHGKDCDGAAFSPDGTRVAGISSGSKRVNVWELLPLEHQVIQGPGARGRLALSPDGTRLALVSRSPLSIQVWDTATGNRIAEFRGQRYVNEVVFSPDGRRLFYGDTYRQGPGAGLQSKVCVLDAVSGVEVASFGAHRNELRALALSPNGRLVATSGGRMDDAWPPKFHDGEVIVRKADKGQVLFTFRTPDLPVHRWCLAPTASAWQAR
jgi:WD40 repeat protein